MRPIRCSTERSVGRQAFDPKVDAKTLLQAALGAEPLTPRELDAIAELASARLAAIEARLAREESGDSGDGYRSGGASSP